MMARRSNRNSKQRLGCIVLLIGLAVAAFIAFRFVAGWTEQGPAAQDVSVVVREGSTLSDAAVLLKQAGAVRSADAFLTRAKIFGAGTPIKAGEFVIPAGASNSDILSILQGGKTLTRLITIPEGMPSILVHERLMANDQLTGDIPVPEEGSVLPDSYAFDKGEPRAAVLKRMQVAMDEALAKLWAERAPNTVAKTPKEAIILASIVEKETAVAAERPTVAGVYSNRLRTNMMLQADPTIIYPITRGKPLGRRIRKSEIADVNDYNTYAMVGLPKGPIANPGRLSILAVLHPAETKALYFVADGKGGHIFADTYQQHNENVRKWFEIRRSRGEL
ncbi:endolytic transglycosylase MltG [Sphingobium sp. ba1]|uniref:endolytic transglycosylase MltG n=1 Tax=Sphingobium sp. ba1 TaxID=1522072 RepID=UPI000559F3FC|nr:endolytic transglycosylase MltG [Sphingobium sp. ba1]